MIRNTISFSLSFSFSLSRSLSPSLSLTHTHAPSTQAQTYSHANTHTYFLPRTFSALQTCSLTHPYTLTQTPNKVSHILSSTHTLAHMLAPSHPLSRTLSHWVSHLLTQTFFSVLNHFRHSSRSDWYRTQKNTKRIKFFSSSSSRRKQHKRRSALKDNKDLGAVMPLSLNWFQLGSNNKGTQNDLTSCPTPASFLSIFVFLYRRFK